MYSRNFSKLHVLILLLLVSLVVLLALSACPPTACRRRNVDTFLSQSLFGRSWSTMMMSNLLNSGEAMAVLEVRSDMGSNCPFGLQQAITVVLVFSFT